VGCWWGTGPSLSLAAWVFTPGAIGASVGRVPRVSFTSHLARHVDCPADMVAGTTAREVLDAYFERHPLVRGYVFDEQGLLRRHVVVFVNEQQAADRKTLSDPVSEDSEVCVMQALSGG
jgi:molybdopterin synthase sulfur carrier subunit